VTGADASLDAWKRALAASGCDESALAERGRRLDDRHFAEAARLFPDARRLLRAAKGELPLALITNGPSDFQRAKLSALGIEHCFDVIIVSGEHGMAKPDPAVFELALVGLGIPPNRAVHAGDSLHSDIGGARASGVTAVWLNRSGAKREEGDPVPDFEVRSFDELGWILEA
jgi:putative hydrolase of the HAD superfamily